MMFARSLFAAAAALALALASPAGAEPPRAFPNDADITALIRTRVEEGRATGIVVGVLEADGSRRIVSYGDPGPGAKPLGPDSVFEIGSITKTFTGALLADMAQRGEVDPARPAQDYAPPGLTMPIFNGQPITLANLAEQNSGLPRLPDNFAPADKLNPYVDYDAARLNAFLGAYQLTRAPGARFEYSNVGVGLLGHLLSGKAGVGYDRLIHHRILDPLGMTSSGLELTAPMRANLAIGHNRAGAPTQLWDFDVIAPAGAIRSSMTDMLTYLDANVGPPANDLERAMRSAQAPRADALGGKIGFIWLTMKRPQGDIVWHDGLTGGYASFIGFDPVRQVGVVVLVNASQSCDDIGFHLLDPSYPLLPKPATPVKRTAVNVPAESLAPLAGVYALDAQPDFTIAFTVENGALVIHPKDQMKGPMQAESPTRFFLTVPEVVIDFHLAADGKADSLILEQNGAKLPAKRIQ